MEVVLVLLFAGLVLAGVISALLYLSDQRARQERRPFYRSPPRYRR